MSDLFQQERLVWSHLSLEYGGFVFQYFIAGLVLDSDLQFGYAALVVGGGHYCLSCDGIADVHRLGKAPTLA